MKLTMQTDYALRTLLYLASKPGRSTVTEVSEFFGISLSHLGKVTRQLGRLGLVRNVRGPGGGDLPQPRGPPRSRWAGWSGTSRGGTFTFSTASTRPASA